MLSRWFTDHPRAIGETYAEHQLHALRFSGELFRASLACFIHALVPGAFEHNASRSVIRLYGEMSRRTARDATAVSDKRPHRSNAPGPHPENSPAANLPARPHGEGGFGLPGRSGRASVSGDSQVLADDLPL